MTGRSAAASAGRFAAVSALLVLLFCLAACSTLPGERPTRPAPPANPPASPFPAVPGGPGSTAPPSVPALPPAVATPAWPTPKPLPVPALAPVSAAEVRAVALRALPTGIKDRSKWADDIATSFAALAIPALPHKVCALAAVIEQESTWQADPPVANLSVIARREIDKKLDRLGIPKAVFELALLKTSPNGKIYQHRLDRLRTERELSELFDDMVREIPLGSRLFEGQNPVHTGGATQVSVSFAAQTMRDKPYPWRQPGSAREEVFKRRGGVYFGAAMLLDYPVSYNRMLYRFADYNAGRYSSRNAAVQGLLAQLTRRPIAPDGDLLRYRGDEPLPVRGDPSQAWRALAELPELELSAAQIERDLRLEKQFEFERTPTYLRLYALAERRGLKPERERLPDIELHSPKITRPLTTAWFAERCETRYRACLAREAALAPPMSTDPTTPAGRPDLAAPDL